MQKIAEMTSGTVDNVHTSCERKSCLTGILLQCNKTYCIACSHFVDYNCEIRKKISAALTIVNCHGIDPSQIYSKEGPQFVND